MAPKSVAVASPNSTATLDGKTVTAVVSDIHDVVVIRY